MSIFFVIVFEIFVRLLIGGVLAILTMYLYNKGTKWSYLPGIFVLVIAINIFMPSSYTPSNRITFTHTYTAEQLRKRQDSINKSHANKKKANTISTQKSKKISTKSSASAKHDDITGTDVRLFFLPKINSTIHYGDAAMEAAVNGDDSANEYLAKTLDPFTGNNYSKFEDMKKKSGPNQKLAIKTHDDLSAYSSSINDAVTSIQLKDSEAKQTAYAAKADKCKSSLQQDYATIKTLSLD